MDARPVHVAVGPAMLQGELTLPDGARAVVVFAHGSSSSRDWPGNLHARQTLNAAKFASLVITLLTPEEEAIDMQTARLRFNIDLLADRLVAASDWLAESPDTQQLPVGCFSASTGAAAALVAASKRPQRIGAVVARGGRPDLAGRALGQVNAPTLLIVGADDLVGLELNQAALGKLRCRKQLTFVPRATDLMKETETLDEVARLARGWFDQHLGHETSPADQHD